MEVLEVGGLLQVRGRRLLLLLLLFFLHLLVLLLFTGAVKFYSSVRCSSTPRSRSCHEGAVVGLESSRGLRGLHPLVSHNKWLWWFRLRHCEQVCTTVEEEDTCQVVHSTSGVPLKGQEEVVEAGEE